MNPALRHLEQRLAALATGLCHDAGIQLRVHGDQWSYDPWHRTLTVSESSLAMLGEDWCAGRLANEVGHYWLTRHDLFRPEFSSQPIARRLLDALDDPRVNGWMGARYPGSLAWTERVQETLDTPPRKPTPLVMRFVRECGLEAGRGWELTQAPLPPPVLEALDATRDARRRYAAIAPPVSVGDAQSVDATRAYVQEVVPRMLRPFFFMPAPYEAEVRLRALQALALAEEEIFPVAEALMKMDQQSAAQWLAQNPDQARQAQTGQGQPQVPWGQPPRPGQPAPLAMRRLAQQLLEGVDQPQDTQRLVDTENAPSPGQPRRQRRGRPGQRPPRQMPRGRGPGSSLEVRTPTPSDYDAARRKMAAQIDDLVTRLERVLQPRQKLRRRAGYPSGRQVHVKSLMAFEADPRLYNRIWMRSTVPERRRVAFSLLVDLSGSMDGEKADTALLGTVLLVETLIRLNVPFAVNGFQADIIPFANFNDPFDSVMRRKLATIPSRADNANDDGPCLLKASEALMEQSVDERFMIVVSDGMPSERDSSEQDLRDAIAHLSSDSTPLHLVGIGLGSGTEHVTDFYPDAQASVPVDKFSEVIGGLIARGLNVA